MAEMKDNSAEGLIFYDHAKNNLIDTYATRCIEAGVQPIVLKKWLGYPNIHVNIDTYADVFARMDFSAEDKFDELMQALASE